MKHSILRKLLLIAVLLTGSHTFAYDFEVDGIYYNVTSVTDLTCEVTFKDVSYNSYSGDIVIPETVTYKSKLLKITSIGEYAFSSCTNMTSLSISNSVTSIKNYAFNGCNSLKQLNIEDGTETLVLGYNDAVNKVSVFDCPIETLYLGRNVTSNYLYGGSTYSGAFSQKKN